MAPGERRLTSTVLAVMVVLGGTLAAAPAQAVDAGALGVRVSEGAFAGARCGTGADGQRAAAWFAGVLGVRPWLVGVLRAAPTQWSEAIAAWEAFGAHRDEVQDETAGSYGLSGTSPGSSGSSSTMGIKIDTGVVRERRPRSPRPVFE